MVNNQAQMMNQAPPTAAPTTGGRRNRVISAYGYKNNQNNAAQANGGA